MARSQAGLRPCNWGYQVRCGCKAFLQSAVICAERQAPAGRLSCCPVLAAASHLRTCQACMTTNTICFIFQHCRSSYLNMSRTVLLDHHGGGSHFNGLNPTILQGRGVCFLSVCHVCDCSVLTLFTFSHLPQSSSLLGHNRAVFIEKQLQLVKHDCVCPVDIFR